MKFSAWYSLIVGIFMIGQWGFFLTTGSVPEVHTQLIALAFHLAAEFVSAILLLAAGYSLLHDLPKARKLGLLASGMLAYSLIASPGYFAQLGQWPLVGMFAVLLILDGVNISLLMKKK